MRTIRVKCIICGVRSVDRNRTTSFIMLWQVHIISVETSLTSVVLQLYILQVRIDEPIFKLSHHVPWSVMVCVWGKKGVWHNLGIWGKRAYPPKIFVWLTWKCNILCAGLQIYKSEMDQLPEFLFVSTIYRGWGKRSTVERPPEVVSRNVEMAPVWETPIAICRGRCWARD